MQGNVARSRLGRLVAECVLFGIDRLLQHFLLDGLCPGSARCLVRESKALGGGKILLANGHHVAIDIPL